MEKVAVLPVPDWAWAMTSWPEVVSRVLVVVVVVVGRELTLDDGHDGALLDSRGALETVGVDTTEKLGLQVHRIEGVGGLIVVRLDLSYSAQHGQYMYCLRISWQRPVAGPQRIACALQGRNRAADSTHPPRCPQVPCRP